MRFKQSVSCGPAGGRFPRACGKRGVRRAIAAAALLAVAAQVRAAPVIQLGNYVASTAAGSAPVITIYVSDPAVTDNTTAAAEDVEGMNFTLQLGTGNGTLPAITNVDFGINAGQGTVWSGKVGPPLGGVDPASGNGPQFQSFAISTNDIGVVINPNGVLARVALNTASAGVGQIAFKMTGTKDSTRDSQFSDGLGAPVPTSITNGTLTLVSNQVLYWTGASNANWDTTTNWSTSAKPTASQDAYFGKPIPGSGANIALTAAPETVNNLWFDGSYTFNGGQITLGGGQITVFSGSSVTINSAIGGSAGLTLSGGGALSTGGGTLTLGGTAANTYSGDTTVNAGTLILNKTGGALAIPGGNLNVNGATLQFNAPAQTGDQTAVTLTNAGAATATMSLAAGANQAIGSLAGNGTVAFAGAVAPTLTVGANGASTIFSGAITGAGSLAKTGSGTLTLSGASLSLSNVAVNGGMLAFTTTAPNLAAGSLSGNWTVGAGTLTLPTGSSVTTIAPAGNVALTAPSASFPALGALASNQGVFSLSNGATFTTASSLTNDGTLSLTGPATALTVTTSLANTGNPGSSGTTTVGSGSSLTANFIRQNALTSTGTTTLRQQSLGGGTSVLSSLSLGGTSSAPVGTLNLADTKMVINDATAGHAATFTAINAMINAAAHYNAGTGKDAWDTPGIGSSLLSTLDNFHNIGTADNATLGVLTKSTFGGQSVSSSSILVAYTLSGDTNLDGKVDFSDFLNFQNHYTHPGTWQDGDFDHNGIVNFSDFLLFQNGYGHSLPGAGPTFITAAENAQVAAFAASVPEPTGMMLLLGGAAGLLGRRYRRNVLNGERR